MDLRELSTMDLSALDRLYADAPLVALPRGRFDGVVLGRLATPGARRAFHYVVQKAGFEWISWGIDFDHARWFFLHPRARMGHFTAHAGRSRWRDTESYGLRYEVSRLPWVGGALYDEIKPLSDSLVLGLGGVNAPVGDGDHFFFALTRRG
jgi:hypothetical protein